MRQFDSASSAIRYGATLRPQAFFWYFRDEGTCAIGGMAEAMGYDPAIDEEVCKAENQFEYLGRQCGGCPECFLTERASLNSVITHLNDDHKWSREQIADWVEQKENELFGYETLMGMPRPQVDAPTLYTLDCPQCRTITVGDDVYDNWREGQGVTCRKCELTSMPETRKVDLAR